LAVLDFLAVLDSKIAGVFSGFIDLGQTGWPVQRESVKRVLSRRRTRRTRISGWIRARRALTF
jgi:hypothetical protein